MPITPFYSHAGITIYHGDCREILPTLPKCDLLLTDAPYAIGCSTFPENNCAHCAQPC